MAATLVELDPDVSRRLDSIAARTGKSRGQLVNEAVERLLDSSGDADENWKSAILQAAGMWKDRDDLPDFDKIRGSMDRNPWSR